MMRLVVWINGLPLLLGKNVEATEENVNAARKRMGLPPLCDGTNGKLADEVNGVSVEWMRGAVIGSIEMKYPEIEHAKRPAELPPKVCICKCKGDDEGIGHTPSAVKGCRWS